MGKQADAIVATVMELDNLPDSRALIDLLRLQP